MSTPPKTVLQASPEEAAAIREAVRNADVASLGERCVAAGCEHVAGLYELLKDPAVSGPILSAPSPVTEPIVEAWVRDAFDRRRAGEAILAVQLDEAGGVAGYRHFTIWPERASATIAGAQRADRQGLGFGKRGAARSFDWMFDELGVRLIAVTAAIDNVRSARVIEAAGFSAMGELDCIRPDGTVRWSRYWEMTRDAWLDRRRSHAG